MLLTCHFVVNMPAPNLVLVPFTVTFIGANFSCCNFATAKNCPLQFEEQFYLMSKLVNSLVGQGGGGANNPLVDVNVFKMLLYFTTREFVRLIFKRDVVYLWRHKVRNITATWFKLWKRYIIYIKKITWSFVSLLWPTTKSCGWKLMTYVQFELKYMTVWISIG